MQIHNFFSDILLSVRTLFDKYIFDSATIKSYQFNLSNRSLVLSDSGFTTTFELPAAIVSLGDDTFHQGIRNNVAQQLITDNINAITVVYNSNTGASIKLQEQLSQVNINVTINCESQFEAKELEFRIKQYLPLNKYIQFLKFSSFLEFPQTLMEKYNFDHLQHDLINLFTKIDRNTGKPIYCYSIHYEPSVMLTSLASTISDMGQRSFAVDVGLTYLIQMPMFVYCDKGDRTIDRVNLVFDQIGEEPICSIPSIPLVLEKPSSGIYVHSVIRETIIIRDDSDYLKTVLEQFLNNSNFLEILRQLINDIVLDALKNFKLTLDDLINYYFDRVITNPYLKFLLFHDPPLLTLEQILYLLVSGYAFNYYLYLLLQKGLTLEDIRNYLLTNQFTNNELYLAMLEKLIDKPILQKYIDFINRLNQFQESLKICILRTSLINSILNCAKSDIRFNFIDTLGRIRYDVQVLDITDERICFQFMSNDFIENFSPTVISPVLIQVIEDRVLDTNLPNFNKRICNLNCTP